MNYCNKEKMRNYMKNMSSQIWIYYVRFHTLRLFANTYSVTFTNFISASTLLLDITSHDAWNLWVSSKIELFWHYMRMFLSGKMYLKGLSDGTLDGLLQVASNRCPVRTLLTQVTFFKLIIAFSSFFFSY